MSDTPPGMASSWVDLSREIVSSGGFSSPLSPRRITPPLPLGSDNDYMRMLREAQRETSCRSSARVSPITSALMSQSSTCRNSPSMSPKSPPNSPRTEVADYDEQLEGVYINRLKEADAGLTDFMWDWSSKPAISSTKIPKEWKIPSSRGSSNSNNTKNNNKSFTKKMAFTFFITNVISLLIGAGIGIWIYRRSDRSIEIAI